MPIFNWPSTITTWFTPTILFCFLNLTIFSIFIASKLKTHKKLDHPSSSSHHLNRVPSLLSRVKSINFSLHKFDHYHALETETLLHEPDPHVTRSMSDTCGETTEGSVPVKMKKSASEVELRRRPATVRERKAKVAYREVDEEGVDAKADDFIKRFKQQLKLQRLDSLLRYKEMLSRGSRHEVENQVIS